MALCAGVGGLELGLSLVIPEYRCVCYVEREAYAVSVLVQRMEEGWLDNAPVWDDVETFDGEQWRGIIDIVSSGFPCQPWSAAGAQKGTEDERWIWSDIARIIGEVGPRYVFLENVPGLVRGGLGEVLRSLAVCGFDAEWCRFSAASIGAPHIRQRIFILARKRDVADTEGMGRGNGAAEDERTSRGEGDTLSDSGEILAHTDGEGLFRKGLRVGGKTAYANVEQGRPEQPKWWEVEPAMGRVADGVANRVDRIRALGNAVVPAVAATAFIELSGRLNRNIEKG